MSKKSINTSGLILIFTIPLMMMVGCTGLENVPMRVTHPAEIDMSEYRQLALNISGNRGQQVGDSLMYELINSGRFQVTDRQHLDSIMAELKLSQSDLSDSTGSTKLGKLMTASALISGNINGNYKEDMISKKDECYAYDEETEEKYKYECTSYKREGKFNLGGSLRIVDIQTGRIVKNVPFENYGACEKTTFAKEEQPDFIDGEALAEACLSENVSAFMRVIAPWTSEVQAPFRTDGAIPELERGVNLVRMGNLKESASIFANAAKAAENNANIKPKSIAKAYSNLGLVYMYTDQFDEAVETFKKAYTFDPSDWILAEKDRAIRLKFEKQKLNQQTSSR